MLGSVYCCILDDTQKYVQIPIISLYVIETS